MYGLRGFGIATRILGMFKMRLTATRPDQHAVRT